MTFNINNQYGGIISNVAGDQYVGGGQHGSVRTAEAAARALSDVRDAVTATLDPETTTEAQQDIQEIDRVVRGIEPDGSRAARSLDRLTRLLVAAGALSAAGGTLATSLRTLAGFLGSVAEPVLRLLPG